MDEYKSIIDRIISEYRVENQISPFREDSEFEDYVKDGIFDINDYCGEKIDYDKDLKARRLLKNYIVYADHNRLAEFKSMYLAEYDELQRDYYVKNMSKKEEENE